jgi:hypothetical protein
VADEVRAKIKDRCNEAINDIEKNCRELGMWASVDALRLDKEKLLKDALKNFEWKVPEEIKISSPDQKMSVIVFGDKNLIITPLYVENIYEAIRRSIERIPPCSKNGEEIRDTMIWLDTLKFCKDRSKKDCNSIEVAFVSRNWREYADKGSDADKKVLKKELSEDIRRYGINLKYFETISEFLIEYAEPIAGVSREWVDSHINIEEIKKLVQEYGLLQNFDYYNSLGDPIELNIGDWNIKLINFYLWPSEDIVEINLIFSVTISNSLFIKREGKYNVSNIRIEVPGFIVNDQISLKKQWTSIRWDEI